MNEKKADLFLSTGGSIQERQLTFSNLELETERTAFMQLAQTVLIYIYILYVCINIRQKPASVRRHHVAMGGAAEIALEPLSGMGK